MIIFFSDERTRDQVIELQLKHGIQARTYDGVSIF